MASVRAGLEKATGAPLAERLTSVRGLASATQADAEIGRPLKAAWERS